MKIGMKQKGVTLIELAIVMILVSILSAGIAEALRVGFQSYVSGQHIINTDMQGRAALSRMTRDLHAIRSGTDIITASPNVLTYRDVYNNLVTYQLSGTSLMRDAAILTDNVQSLVFHYYDETGAELTAFPIDTTAVRYIVIDLNLYKETSFSFITGVALWNFI